MGLLDVRHSRFEEKRGRQSPISHIRDSLSISKRAEIPEAKGDKMEDLLVTQDPPSQWMTANSEARSATSLGPEKQEESRPRDKEKKSH